MFINPLVAGGKRKCHVQLRGFPQTNTTDDDDKGLFKKNLIIIIEEPCDLSFLKIGLLLFQNLIQHVTNIFF